MSCCCCPASATTIVRMPSVEGRPALADPMCTGCTGRLKRIFRGNPAAAEFVVFDDVPPEARAS